MSSTLEHERARLEKYYHEVTQIITVKQNPASGLIPASVAKTAHGDYTDAWVRDNVYSILAVWSLGLAYRRLDDDLGRAYELEHATIKCMRGLLFAMMRQSAKVERFKNTQHRLDSLHAKYKTSNGETVVGDNEWGHLQIDATSIFLLYLAQMTVSGLHIIYTLDEVQFVQNLVFYIERAYRTPDYGIWERGNKINHGQPELNCSSIGMVVAALEAINGINLFGSRGGPSSVIHVLPDEITRNFVTLNSALPRESASKEIDAALLSVVSFPAFSVVDSNLRDKTRKEIEKKLGGRYGCKRFLRDGHQTMVEDHNRLHYEPHELKIFEHIESEWPLFFTYLILDGLFRGDMEQTRHYRQLLKPLLIPSSRLLRRDGKDPDNEDENLEFGLVPELYIVPVEAIDAERQNPGSQDRIPNQNIPLVWAQSLYIMGNLIHDGLISPADVDPLARRLKAQTHRLKHDTVVQIVLIAENEDLQSKLLMYGLETYTAANCNPITISKPSSLKDAYLFLGKNAKFGLSGRPDRPVGTLSTCKIYRCQGQLYVFIPHFMDREEFYLVSDNDYLVSLFEQEISYVRNNWMEKGRPTMVIMLTNQMVGDLNKVDESSAAFSAKRNLLNFLISISSSGLCRGARVRVGRLSEMINTACVESLDFLVNHGSDSSKEWEGILRGYKKQEHEILKVVAHTETERISIRNSHRRIRKHTDDNLSITSPLAKCLGYSNDLEIEEISLLDTHREEPEHADSSPYIPLSVVLGNPSNAKEAIEMLHSVNGLVDQVELLHYLFSCFGLSFEIPGLATIEELVEEIYLKAMLLKEWSVVRTAAGILKKNVNALTGSLTDLLIRQKPITIGARPHEYFIDTPHNPQQLSKIIYEHCTSDIREGPLVQEIITYLGSIIRSSPALFSGIMRIRTHYFVLAMREEISRSYSVNEMDAIELLMKLSPFETKTLLQQVLISHDQVEFSTKDKSPELLTAPQRLSFTRLSTTVSTNNLGNELKIFCQSGGFFAGNFAEITIYRDSVVVPMPLIPGRGINVVTLDPYDGSIISAINFDLHFSAKDSDHFVTFMQSLEEGTIVALCGKDDFTESLNENGIKAIELIGANLIRNVKYRDSYCIIGQVGDSIGNAAEDHMPAKQGPVKVEKTYALMQGHGLLSRRATLFNTILPSKGWWIRRRRNDGALNRVPNNFYPKVWYLLSEITEIRVGEAVLKSDPTISESTPEEFNFSLQVENILDNFLDPAENQIAVECLVVISRLNERNPELVINKTGFDLKALIYETIKEFWNQWVSQQSNQEALSPIANDSEMFRKVIESAARSPISQRTPPTLDLRNQNFGNREVRKDLLDNSLTTRIEPERLSSRSNSNLDLTDFSFETNFKLARRLFFDLRQDGPKGTMSYLAASCVKLAFGVTWDSSQIVSYSVSEK